MSQQIHCPHCGQVYDLTDEQVPQYSGQTINCTQCNRPFTVPHLQSSQRPPFNPPGGTMYSQQGVASYRTPDPAAPSNGLAISSLVLGILGFCVPLLGIIGVILGIFGLKRANAGQARGQGLAVAGITVSAISIVMSCVMGSILLPSLNRAREAANRVKCAANMRQIGQALIMYANDDRMGRFPPDLRTAIETQELPLSVAVCPTSGDTAATTFAELDAGGHLSYIYVGDGLTMAAGAADVVLYEPMSDHKNEGTNVLFGDGHVQWVSQAQAQQLLAGLPTTPPAAVERE